MKSKQKITLATIIFIGISIFLYLAFSFVLMELNAQNWSEASRLFFAMLSIFGGGFASSAVFVFND